MAKRLGASRNVEDVGKWMQSRGLTPAENRLFGDVDSDAHTSTSLHYQRGQKGNLVADKQGDLALDVNDISIADSMFFRVMRGHWKIWRPQSEFEALRFLFKKVQKMSQKKGWPLDEMFFNEFGFRVETGFGVNTPIENHETHLHAGWSKFSFNGQ
jgi:hypothetical protein